MSYHSQSKTKSSIQSYRISLTDITLLLPQRFISPESALRINKTGFCGLNNLGTTLLFNKLCCLVFLTLSHAERRHQLLEDYSK